MGEAGSDYRKRNKGILFAGWSRAGRVDWNSAEFEMPVKYLRGKSGGYPVLWALQLKREIWAQDFAVIGMWFNETKGVKKIAQRSVFWRRIDIFTGQNTEDQLHLIERRRIKY